MKKFFLVLLVVLFLLSGCNIKTQVSGNIGIPNYVSHIEFWNGGGLVRSYDNATVYTKIDSATKVVGANIYFYRYEITIDNKTEIIVDSESLSIVYTK